MYHFASLIAGTGATVRADQNLITRATAVKNALTLAVISNGKSGSLVASSSGLTIYLPRNPWDYDTDYENTIAFAQNISSWTDFIKHDSPTQTGK